MFKKWNLKESKLTQNIDNIKILINLVCSFLVYLVQFSVIFVEYLRSVRELSTEAQLYVQFYNQYFHLLTHTYFDSIVSIQFHHEFFVLF